MPDLPLQAAALASGRSQFIRQRSFTPNNNVLRKERNITFDKKHSLSESALGLWKSVPEKVAGQSTERKKRGDKCILSPRNYVTNRCIATFGSSAPCPPVPFPGFTLSHSFATPKSSWVCKAAGAPRVSLRVFAQNLPGTPSPQSQAGRGALKSTSHCLALQMQELCNSLGCCICLLSHFWGFGKCLFWQELGTPGLGQSPRDVTALSPCKGAAAGFALGQKIPQP